MGTLAFIRSAVGIGLAVALLVGCGGSHSASPLPIQPMTQRQDPVHTTGNGYKLLYSFQGGTDGEHPSGRLASLNGVLYGLTSIGGSGCPQYPCGTVFSMTTSGTEAVLYSFQGGNDGANPTGGLLVVNGSLYGTTQNGGTTYGYCYGGCGTVFKVSTSGDEQVLYRFQGGSDGYFPSGDLTALRGVLYGTTSNGGGSGCGGRGCGTVFRITTAGTEKV
ncbi:MAG TPA: choice-of-anchor tandem repeat GloVer-containing protein, partial [Candidatus Nitrosotalea sp.]|nr:choice-of-anchor tandem repeat GloVer-containing protein [Candidatus Nitrosotalea sp.]